MLIEILRVQGCDTIFTFCHTLLKTAILHYKRPKVAYSFSLTVHLNQYFDDQVGRVTSQFFFAQSTNVTDKIRSPWDHPRLPGSTPSVIPGQHGKVYRGQGFTRKCPRSRHFLVTNTVGPRLLYSLQFLDLRFGLYSPYH